MPGGKVRRNRIAAENVGHACGEHGLTSQYATGSPEQLRGTVGSDGATLGNERGGSGGTDPTRFETPS